MNFFNDKELAQRLRKKEVSEREKFYYFISTQMIYIFFATSFYENLLSQPITQWSIAGDISAFLFMFFGLIWVYQTNANGDNKNLIERAVCVGFPIIFRSIVLWGGLLAILSIATVVITYYFPSEFTKERATAASFVIGQIVTIYTFYRLNLCIKIASR